MKGTENRKLIELFQLSDGFKNNILFRLGVVSSCGTRQTSEKNMRAHARLGQHVARGECGELVSPRVVCPPESRACTRNLLARLSFAEIRDYSQSFIYSVDAFTCKKEYAYLNFDLNLKLWIRNQRYWFLL